MQTAVQTTTEAPAGTQVAGRHTGAKAKQAGGFAALLAAFFGKGGQPGGMEVKGAASAGNAELETPLKGKGGAARKGAPLAGMKAVSKDLPALKKGDGEAETPESALLPGMGEVPLVPLLKGEPLLNTAFAQGMADAAAEKSAGADKGRAAGSAAPKGGLDRMPLQAGGAPAAGNQPHPAMEMGVDRFAAMMREAAQPKQAARREHAGVTLAGPAGNPLSEALSAPSENKAAEVLAGNAAGAGAKKSSLASDIKADGAKGGPNMEASLAGAGQAAKSSKKENPLLAGRELRGRVPQVEEPAASPRIVKPVAVDRAVMPMQPLSPEATAALNELEPSLAADTPKTGLTRQLALQVGRQVATSLKKNDHEVTFQVRPPSLGRLQMRIEKEGEKISVRIVSEKEKAGEILAAGKHELRVLLADHGIRVDRIDVEAGGPMDFMSQGGGAEDRSGRGRSNANQRAGGEAGSADAEHEAAPSETKRHDGAISVMA